MNAYTLLIICVFFARFSTSNFQHRVESSCDFKDQECLFQFDVHYTETMVHFSDSEKSAVPVVYRNGTFYKRNTYSCDSFEELSEQEMQHIITADGSSKLLFTINGQLPGPPVVVYEGQTVVVNVKNNLINEGLTIHWHGMVQKDTPWMDGASMLTQCPINTNEVFQYRFKANPSGTHWYHSHHGAQRTDGIAGPLIVLPRPSDERHDIPDVERDFIMMFQEWTRNTSILEVNLMQRWMMGLYCNERNSSVCYHGTKTADNTNIGDIPFHSALINGRGHFYPNNDEIPDLPELPLEVFHVKHDRYVRFRMINAALMFPFRIYIDQHVMVVISTDGYDVIPHATESVIVSPGERIDVIVKADVHVGNYWIRVETLGTKYRDGKQRVPGKVMGILRYDGAPKKLPNSSARKCTERRPCTVVNCPFLKYPRDDHTHCIPLTDLKSTKALLYKYPVPISKDEPIEEIFFNFHFASNGKNQYSPAINAHKFQFPSCPPQVTYIPEAKICFDSCYHHDCSVACKCTYTVTLYNLDKPVQFVLVNNDDLNVGMAHPIHIHGHGFHVIKVAYADTDDVTGSITGGNPHIKCSGANCQHPTWTNKEWEGGNVPDVNLINPPIKDTVVVPRQGYVVIRFPLDNPGYWYMHCHVETHQLEGMTVILKEGPHYDMAPPPPHFPLCGSFNWTNKEFENHLKLMRAYRERRKIDAQNNTQTTTDFINNSKTDDMLPLAYILILILIGLFIICLTFGVTVWLCDIRRKQKEYKILQEPQVLHYGTLSNK